MPQVTKGPLLKDGQVDLQLAFPLGFNNKRTHRKKICSLIFFLFFLIVVVFAIHWHESAYSLICKNWGPTLHFKGIWVVAKTKKWWTGHEEIRNMLYQEWVRKG